MHINILIEKNKKQCVWKCINLWLYARYQMKKKENHLKMNCCDMVLNAFQKNLFMPCQWRYIR